MEASSDGWKVSVNTVAESMARQGLQGRGRVADDPAARYLRIMAAGRIVQHHALWPTPADQLVGSRSRAIGQDDYAVTHYAVQPAH